MSKRILVVDTAQYWYDHAKDGRVGTYEERMIFLDNALNHTENMLAFVLRDLLGMEDIAHVNMTKIQLAFDEAIKPPFLKLPTDIQDHLIDFCMEGIRDQGGDITAEVLCSYDWDMLENALKAIHEADMEEQRDREDPEVIEPEDQDQGDIEGHDNEQPSF